MGIGGILCVLADVYVLVLLARIILSWVPSLPEPLAPLARALHAVTDPVLMPLRRVLPPLQLGGLALDLSPLVVFFLIAFILRPLLCAL